MRAFIRESECIGCTKCIQACPYDAILGTAKQMHTVIGDECTGCELCIAPCPVDCIDLIASENYTNTIHAEKRLQARQQRLKIDTLTKPRNDVQTDRKAYIAAALQRFKSKKSTFIQH